ncbi:MAG: cyaB [Gemmatimonadetes bacterium]|nr:cyaB [Gemmatimonadota bacterium]
MKSSRQVASYRTPSLREALSYFWRLSVIVRPYWGGIARGLALGLIAGTLALATPFFSKLYFDSVYPTRDISLMHGLVLGVAAFTIASALVGTLRGYYSQMIAVRMNSAVSLMYFNHLQHLPIRFFDDHRVGEIMSRLGDMRSSLGAVSRMFQTVLLNGVYLLLVPPFLVALNWKLSVVSLISTPLVVVISTMTSRVTRRYIKQTAETNGDLNATQVEALSQIRTLKAMAVEHEIFVDVKARTEEAMRLQLKAAGVGAVVGIGNTMLRAAGTALFTWYAWTLILNGEMTLGSFVAFSAYLGYLTGPVGQLAGIFADFQQSAISLGRAFEYLDLLPEQSPDGAYTKPDSATHPLRGEIQLESVCFGYAADRPVLRDISLDFLPGTITALVGSSGAGKSSVLRLLCRMESPDSGCIRMDGTPLDQIPLHELRRQMAVVWQEPTLLRGSIWDNLVIGFPETTRDSVDRAIRICQLDSLIANLPLEYETMVAEWGATLSGGQRQRFSLARALICDAPILLLDETTSQVDVQTEESLFRAMIPGIKDKTVVLVTHRMATAGLAHKIVVMDDGMVVGVGNHSELLANCPHYRQMVQAARLKDDVSKPRMLGVL